jgi:hypothetical protein
MVIASFASLQLLFDAGCRGEAIVETLNEQRVSSQQEARE